MATDPASGRAAENQLADQLSGDRSEQNAVAEVAGGVDQTRQFSVPAEDGEAVGSGGA